jgi:hypothetical protein
MDGEVRWERIEYESRLDALTDELPEFIGAVLGTIDYPAVRADDRRWPVVVEFFGGCREAACCQDSATSGRHHPVVGYFDAAFPGARCAGSGPAGTAGYAEFMDWLSDPVAFQPTRLRPLLESISAG